MRPGDASPSSTVCNQSIPLVFINHQDDLHITNPTSSSSLPSSSPYSPSSSESRTNPHPTIIARLISFKNVSCSQTNFHLLPLLTASCALISSLANLVSGHHYSSWYTWTSAFFLFTAILVALVSQFRSNLWPFYTFFILISTDIMLRVGLLFQLLTFLFDGLNKCDNHKLLLFICSFDSESPFNRINLLNSLTLHTTCLFLQLLSIVYTLLLIIHDSNVGRRRLGNSKVIASTIVIRDDCAVVDGDVSRSIANDELIETRSLCPNQNVATV